MKSVQKLTKKLALHKETIRVLTEQELSRAVGGDSTGASAGQSCECTLGCPKRPRQPTSSVVITEGCPSVYAQF